METTPTTKTRRRNRVVIGAAGAALTLSLAGGAGYWWHERNQASQASAADCRMARTIITEAQQVSAGPAPEAEKWERRTAQRRRTEMEDGYLGYNIAQYESWAVLTAQKSPEAPSAEDVRDLQDKARGHCADSGVSLTMPPLGA
ncbi:hypothetical protein STENM36S_03386 [Streptomyces tendae]